MAIHINTELLRDKRGKRSQADIAQQLQEMGLTVTGNYYGKLERGKVEKVSVDLALAIASLYGLQVEDFIKFIPEESPKEIRGSKIPQNIKKKIGMKLRELRKDSGMTAREVALKIGVEGKTPETYIYDLERGSGSIERMNKLSELYGSVFGENTAQTLEDLLDEVYEDIRGELRKND
ncbi:helix-turn-helix domain-containing protein [Agaribacter marinus]|uniref:Transcriptional regulator n=1 Tax=Virgibacillus salarius TaxID=447199 RepID=A0A941IAT1_9BACI|nr:helix-turn-helix transcriptional regulator [Virgibacillus salarius]MBR7796983.1 transcriptional regulator [Virgibacillus salarius]NAZ09693.1 helix-turn-helix domain-containing protein [Agaribacter marinus]